MSGNVLAHTALKPCTSEVAMNTESGGARFANTPLFTLQNRLFLLHDREISVIGWATCSSLTT